MAIAIRIRLSLSTQIKKIQVNPMNRLLFLEVLLYDLVDRRVRNREQRRAKTRSGFSDLKLKSLRKLRSQRRRVRNIEVKRVLNSESVEEIIERCDDMEMVRGL